MSFHAKLHYSSFSNFVFAQFWFFCLGKRFKLRIVKLKLRGGGWGGVYRTFINYVKWYTINNWRDKHSFKWPSMQSVVCVKDKKNFLGANRYFFNDFKSLQKRIWKCHFFFSQYYVMQKHLHIKNQFLYVGIALLRDLVWLFLFRRKVCNSSILIIFTLSLRRTASLS